MSLAAVLGVLAYSGILLAYLLEVTYRRRLLRTLERERNAFIQQQNILLDRLAHASKNPWTLPPREVPQPEEEEEPQELGWHEL